MGCQFGSRLPPPRKKTPQPPGQSWPTTVSTRQNSTQCPQPGASGVVKTEKPGGARAHRLIRGWCRRTSSPWRGSRRQARGWWGGPRVCVRHSTPSGRRPLWRPGTLRTRSADNVTEGQTVHFRNAGNKTHWASISGKIWCWVTFQGTCQRSWLY